MMETLSDKTAIVTGSSAGIGKAIAGALAQLGAHVIVTSRSGERAQAVAEELIMKGGQATPCIFDIDDATGITPFIEKAAQISGRIDILVNNALSRASIAPPLFTMNYAALQAGVTANLTNVLAITIAAYPYLKEARGIVLNIGSAVVNRHTIGVPLYTILKGALNQTTKVLASEWAGDGIRVNQINPGFVRTDSMTTRQSAATVKMMTEMFTKLHPLGRVGEVEDVASLAAFLVSKQAEWITGASIDIDGGFSVQGATFPAPS
ncbi:MAG: SDR family oxidoreductase [Deltaproteobacteria bacterium]|nr:SDR family oxidoreductase [Deltaproteobacteria bacterium]